MGIIDLSIIDMSTCHPMPLESQDYQEIREAVRALCARFPNDYWRVKDRDRAYPSEFVAALTEAGYLAALIPEAYGGSGLPLAAAAAILEEIQASGGNGAACHAQMYTMGTLLRHGSAAQREKYLPDIASGALRLQAFGVTEPTSGTDTLSLRTTAARAAASRRTWQSCWPPMLPGPPARLVCRPMAAMVSPRSSTWGASTARPASIRWRRSRPISS